jgi:DNA-directed RNA polymerase specialized sigma24 family protein
MLAKPDAEMLSDADLLELTALGDHMAFARLYHSVSPHVTAVVRQLLDELSTPGSPGNSRTPGSLGNSGSSSSEGARDGVADDGHIAVVHEVFVDVWQLAPQFEEMVERRPTPAGGVPVISGADSTAWILKVARRHAIDRRRSVMARHTDERGGADHRGVGHQAFRQHALRPHGVAEHGVGEHGAVEHVIGEHVVHTHSPRECRLTGVEREALALAFGGGYTEDEVAIILDERVATVRSRLNRGLLRLQSWSRAHRSGIRRADSSHGAQPELERCARCHRSAQLLLEPAQRGAGEAAASILPN